MMLKTGIHLLSFAAIVSAHQYMAGDNLFEMCGEGDLRDVEFGSDQLLFFRMDADDWPRDKLSCTVVFKSERALDKVTYRFDHFNLSDPGITVTMWSKDAYSSYSPEVTYSMSHTPGIEERMVTNMYLKITVTRNSADESGLRAGFDVYSTGTDCGMSIGPIMGIVMGVIVVVAVTIVVIVCCVIKSKNRRKNAGVVIAADVGKPGGPPETMATKRVYPYVTPPEQHTMHPAYPVYPPPPYTTAPPPYPGTSTPDSAKPAKEEGNV